MMRIYSYTLLFVFYTVNETTTDIICVKCKQDSSDKGNEIVLCDQCGYGKYSYIYYDSWYTLMHGYI